jgi:hypothetical protein
MSRDTADVHRGQRRAGQHLAADVLVEQVQHRGALLAAAGHHTVGQRPGDQLGELLRFSDALFPGARPLGDLQPQRVVLGGERGEHRADVLGLHAGTEPQDQRNAPAAGVAQAVVEEVLDIGRHRRVRGLVGRLAGQPAGHIPGDQLSGQRSHRRFLVEVLRRQLDAFVGRGHRDADRDQRVTAQLEEIGVAVDGADTQAL